MWYVRIMVEIVQKLFEVFYYLTSLFRLLDPCCYSFYFSLYSWEMFPNTEKLILINAQNISLTQRDFRKHTIMNFANVDFPRYSSIFRLFVCLLVLFFKLWLEQSFPQNAMLVFFASNWFSNENCQWLKFSSWYI